MEFPDGAAPPAAPFSNQASSQGRPPIARNAAMMPARPLLLLALLVAGAAAQGDSEFPVPAMWRADVYVGAWRPPGTL